MRRAAYLGVRESEGIAGRTATARTAHPISCFVQTAFSSKLRWFFFFFFSFFPLTFYFNWVLRVVNATIITECACVCFLSANSEGVFISHWKLQGKFDLLKINKTKKWGKNMLWLNCFECKKISLFQWRDLFDSKESIDLMENSQCIRKFP